MADLRLYPASLPTLYEVLRAVAVHPAAGIDAVARSAGLGRSTTGRALSSLVAIGLIARDGRGALNCTATEVTRAADDATLASIVRRALLAYRPLESLFEGLALGETMNHALRKTAVHLGLDAREIERLATAVKWAEELGIVEREDGALRLAATVVPAGSPAPVLLRADVDSEAKARLFIATRLGRDVFDHLDESNRQLIAGSLLDVETDAPRAVERCGQALENYLREIAVATGFGNEAKALNGAGQLANLLVSKSLIHPHHQKLVDSVSTFRNAKAHHKDKKTLVAWTITADAAAAAVATALVAVRSIHVWVNGGTQTL